MKIRPIRRYDYIKSGDYKLQLWPDSTWDNYPGFERNEIHVHAINYAKHGFLLYSAPLIFSGEIHTPRGMKIKGGAEICSTNSVFGGYDFSEFLLVRATLSGGKLEVLAGEKMRKPLDQPWPKPNEIPYLNFVLEEFCAIALDIPSQQTLSHDTVRKVTSKTDQMIKADCK